MKYWDTYMYNAEKLLEKAERTTAEGRAESCDRANAYTEQANVYTMMAEIRRKSEEESK